MASVQQRESSFCDKDQNDAIIRALYDQKQSTTFCDVVMKVCGREIYAHSNILAAASPYFSQFLGQDTPRTFSQKIPQVIEIQIDGSEPNLMYEEAVAAVIDFIYTGKMSVKEGNAAQIIEIARIMQLDNIVKFCEDFITGRTPDGITVVNGKLLTQYMDGSMNTDKSFDVNQRVQLVDFITSVTDPSLVQPTSKVKPSKMLSIATQVMPQLLGLQPDVSQTKEVGTSTDRRLFESMGYSPSSGRRGPGRRPNYLKDVTYFQRKSLDPKPAMKQTEPPLVCEQVENETPEPTVTDTPVIDDNEAESAVTEENPTETPIMSTPEIDTPKSPSGAGSATRQRYKKLFTELTVEPELKSSSRRKASLSNDNDSTPPKAKDSAVGITSPKAKTKKDQTPQRAKPSHDLVGLTTRSGRKLVKQEIVEITPASLEPETDDSNREEGEISYHAVLLTQVTKKEKEDGEVDYIGEVEEGEMDTSLDDLEESPAVGRGGRRSSRKRGRPKRDEEFEVFFGGDSNAPKKYACGTCDFQTNKVREMSNHNKLHKLEQNTCFYCEEKFDDHDVLTQHMEKHKGPNPFFCSACDSRFKSRTQLNLHLPKHSDDKPFICEICSQGFKWKHALKSHMITHSNKKDHLCAICGYATAHKSQLKAHHLIHTGQTYKCEFPGCRFQATKLQNMKYHILTHTREKPHQCEVCGQSFSLVKNMRRHMLLHSADKSFKCNECDFCSTRYDKLKEHRLKLHGFGTPPEKRVRISDMVEANLSQVTLHGRQYFTAEGLIAKTEVDTDPTITILNPPTVELPLERDLTLSADENQSVQLLQNQTILITQGDGTEDMNAVNMAEVAVSIPSNDPSIMQAQGMSFVEGTLVQGSGEEQYQYTEVMIPASQMDVDSLVQTVYVTAQPPPQPEEQVE